MASLSYQQLIMCVDHSYSMSGDKIVTAMNCLNGIAKELNCNKTHYYKFNTAITKVYSYSGSTLQCDGGTSIEYCLTGLFNHVLRRIHQNGGKTKFIFVTDAEDSVKICFI